MKSNFCNQSFLTDLTIVLFSLLTMLLLYPACMEIINGCSEWMGGSFQEFNHQQVQFFAAQ